MRILELCAGYGGLGIAVEQLTAGRVVFVAETDPCASAVLAARFPDAPNLGDVRSIDWALLRGQVDVITAGFPCQDISHAGRREGIEGERSRIWADVVDAVRILRPHHLYVENVSALRTRGLDRVAGDLAAIGYDMRWTCLRAGDAKVGAPHARDRWFAVAYPASPTAHPDHVGRNRRIGRRGQTAGRAEPQDSSHPPSANGQVALLPTPKASDGPKGSPNQRDSQGLFYLPGQAVRLDRQWRSVDGTDYAPAIRRWEHIVGRPAPRPTELTRLGNYRLSPTFVEWMMGLEPMWVTGLGLPRGQAIRILGNGVVPQQAYRAYRMLTANVPLDATPAPGY
ncbi:DNA cytosine methyltransferase [Kitasatospora purpeofusca]|uniref:DNA cytosine methyltransferase n=1 Tax=Kitasatospora purpeofusca TaxID=67352 RepID=UPI002E11E1A7|nr:DNA cytosine methyltransferase [Kitasatospora purpeofusca]WSR40357.1 DNA cytosine methyltransferase [Kitasatospora purpeofusca]